MADNEMLWTFLHYEDENTEGAINSAVSLFMCDWKDMYTSLILCFCCDSDRGYWQVRQLIDFYFMITSLVVTVFNKALISQPWYWYPHAGQQLHKTRYHCPPPKWKWNFGTGKTPAESFLSYRFQCFESQLNKLTSSILSDGCFKQQ